MVRIRLRRVGSKNQPSYRIVAAEKEAPRDGRFLEALGHYNPRTEPSTIVVDEARLFHWMQNGAQPSDAVVKALRALGTWERWERFKQGEPIEKLLEEAKRATPEVDPRTRRDDLFGKAKKKKSKKAAEEAPTAEAESAEAPAEEQEAVAEPEAEVKEAPEEKQEEAEVEVEPAEEAEPAAEEGAKAEEETEAEAEPVAESEDKTEAEEEEE
jgi:small subunit ribosomal protein S16